MIRHAFAGFPGTQYLHVSASASHVRLYSFRAVPDYELEVYDEIPVLALSDAEIQEELAKHTSGHLVKGVLIKGESVSCTKPWLELVSTQTIDAGVQLGSGEWTDFANFVFLLDMDGNIQPPFNRHAATVDSKMASGRYLNAHQRNCALQVIVPVAKGFKSFLQDAIISLAYNVDFGFDANVGFEKDLADPFAVSRQNFYAPHLPKLTLTGPSTVDPLVPSPVTVKLTDGTGKPYRDGRATVYLEAVSGYLPHTRVDLNEAGEGSFRVMALGLEDGDLLRIKAGFRNFSGMAEYVAEVEA
jgi:hypothetical protein